MVIYFQYGVFALIPAPALSSTNTTVYTFH